jgi:hypothetical protein
MQQGTKTNRAKSAIMHESGGKGIAQTRLNCPEHLKTLVMDRVSSQDWGAE